MHEPPLAHSDIASGVTIQRKTPNKPQSSKATRISSRNPQDPPRPGSADTPTSNGTSAKTKKSTAVRSSKKLATVPKQLDVKVNLSNRDNTYIAPHSRAPAVSRASGNGSGLRTYSRIPLHLRGKTRDIIITRYATLIGCILDSTKPEVLLHGRARCRFGGVHFPNTA